MKAIQSFPTTLRHFAHFMEVNNKREPSVLIGDSTLVGAVAHWENRPACLTIGRRECLIGRILYIIQRYGCLSPDSGGSAVAYQHQSREGGAMNGVTFEKHSGYCTLRFTSELSEMAWKDVEEATKRVT